MIWIKAIIAVIVMITIMMYIFVAKGCNEPIANQLYKQIMVEWEI